LSNGRALLLKLWNAACLALREPAGKPKLALRAISTRSNRFMSGTMARKIVLLSEQARIHLALNTFEYLGGRRRLGNSAKF
jgi:hypothetical protein